eukprot:gene67764-92829_t
MRSFSQLSSRGERRMTTHGSATWTGGINDGKGTLSTKSG